MFPRPTVSSFDILLLNGNLDTAFPVSMAILSGHWSSANCIQLWQLAAQWKSGHSFSSFCSTSRHWNQFFATMPESWAERMKLLDATEDALTGEFPWAPRIFSERILGCGLVFVFLNLSQILLSCLFFFVISVLYVFTFVLMIIIPFTVCIAHGMCLNTWYVFCV